MKKLILLFIMIGCGLWTSDIHSSSYFWSSPKKNSTREPLPINATFIEVQPFVDGTTLLNAQTKLSTIPSGIYYSNNHSSNETVGTGNNVKFIAGESILLDAGFTVQIGASFSAEIIPCGGQ